MEQDGALSPQTRRLRTYTSPRYSLGYRSPRALENWRRQDLEELHGPYEALFQASAPFTQGLSRVCPLCFGHASTPAGECTGCYLRMVDPQELRIPPLGASASSTQTESLLPAFGEVITDVGAPRSELDSRESCPLDLPISNTIKADDEDEASLHGEAVAPTTDGEGEGGDWETDAGSEEIVYEADVALAFAASVPLPDEDGNDDSDHQDDGDEGENESEVKEEGTGKGQESGEAEPDDGERATDDGEDDDDEGDDAGTPAGFSSFRHPDAPTHNWISADRALQMIVRGRDTNGKVIPAASTEAMMTIFPPSQRLTQLPNERWKCRATARINLETMDWEEFACDGRTYRHKNDLRRHFTEKHLGDERAEKRCMKRKLDDEEDPELDLPATKRARRR